MTAKEIIKTLELLPHPEGGFYKETYRASTQLLNATKQHRNISTSIYYLLEAADKSHFHRIKSDELWYFHQGHPLQIRVIIDDQLQTITLGNDIINGEVPQAMIPSNHWFASGVKDSVGFSLVSCSVAPGFDFHDFEMAKRDELVAAFPHLQEVIRLFTRP